MPGYLHVSNSYTVKSELSNFKQIQARKMEVTGKKKTEYSISLLWCNVCIPFVQIQMLSDT